MKEFTTYGEANAFAKSMAREFGLNVVVKRTATGWVVQGVEPTKNEPPAIPVDETGKPLPQTYRTYQLAFDAAKSLEHVRRFVSVIRRVRGGYMVVPQYAIRPKTVPPLGPVVMPRGGQLKQLCYVCGGTGKGDARLGCSKCMGRGWIA